MGAAVARNLVFQPPVNHVCAQTIVHSNVDSTHLWLETRQNSKIEAFFIDRRAPLTVLFSHANAEDVSMIYGWLRDLSVRLKVNVASYSYTGYAKSEGTPSEENVYGDVEAVWEYLTVARKLKPDSIIFYSRSVGSGPTLYLAQKLCKLGTPPCGVVLQSPILSIWRIAFDFRMTLPGDMFPNVDRIPDVECPIFVMHGTHDEVVPFWHGQELFLSTRIKWRHKPFWITGAGHNNIEMLLRESGLLFKKLSEFFDHCVANAKKKRQRP